MKLFGAGTNAAVASLTELDTTARVLFFLRSVPQLLGEEVLTILPFLAVLDLAHRRLGLSRFAALIAAWLLSSILFGLVHLPSYYWNLLQCLVVIGSARLVLLLPYMLTKNTLVSTGAHVLNDWTIFGVVVMASMLTTVQ